MRRRLAILLVTALSALLVPGAPAGAPAGPATAAAATRPLPARLHLDPGVRQLVSVTSDRWADRRATLQVWRKRADGWHRVRGPVTVRLGWSGWVPAAERRQSSGTTPAGLFTLPSAFGTRPGPGGALHYRHVDGDDVWPYEPRDPATYNILQPYRARTSHWRADYRERLASYDREYAHAVVLGFNLPRGVHWSTRRHQYVATDPADTRRGGGIFLHVQGSRYTAGCVAGPLADIRWIVRWLDPALRPRIVMGPRPWVLDRF